jgi:subtilisin family serine protease
MHYAVIRRFALIAVVAVPAYSFDRPSAPGVPASVPRQLVVKLRAGVSPGSASLTALEATHGVVGRDPLPGSVPPGLRRPASRDARAPEGGEAVARALEEGFERTFVLRLRSTADLDAALRAYRQDPGVEYAERNAVFRAEWIPNDPYLASQGSWGQPHADLYGVHLTGSVAAWDTTRGAGIMVAVVDSGLDASHPDIDGNVWTNPGEIPNNGIDDDGNGYPDDVHGWDFVAYDNVPEDAHGHGTLVAGIVAAEANNGLGIVGIAPEAKILPVRGLDATASGTAVGLTAAILYAVANGADVVTASWGTGGSSLLVEDAVAYAHASGVVFVAAAGNAGMDVIDFTPAWVTDAVTVAASDHQDRRAAFSNWGLGVDVTAPGTGILSLRAQGTDMYGGGTHVVGGQYYWASGTSMAAPHVAGAAALLLAAFPEDSIDVVRDRLAFGADDLGALNPDRPGQLGGGRLNAARSLSVPLAPATLAVSGTLVDRQGVPIPSARVELGEMGSGRAYSAGDGTYAFRGLRAGGRYTVAASRPGFEFAPAVHVHHPLTGSALHQNAVGVKRWDLQPVDTDFAAGWPYTSIAVDAQGRPHIAYFIDLLQDLRYAWWTGHQWIRQTVDAPGNAGISASVALDGQNRAHLAYLSWNGEEPGPTVRYARRGDFDWEIEDVTAPSTAFGTHIAVDTAGRPHILYSDYAQHALRYAWREAGGWHVETVNPGGILGYDHALVLDAQGRPHVVYEDLPGAAGTSGLKYAVRTAGTWHTSLVDPALGAYDCAIALDAADRPHVAYLSRFTNLLTYAAPNGAAWTRETAASSPGLGFGLSLEVQGGMPQILHHSPTDGLRYITRSAAGWKSSIVHAGDAGFFNDTAVGAGGTLHVAYHDRRNVYLVHGRSIQLSDPPWAPPTVALTSPANGAFLLGVVTVSAAPHSAAGILRVEFEVDGALRHVDATAPYTFAWNASEAGTVLHTLTARAVDATGARVEHSVQVYGVNVRPAAD